VNLPLIGENEWTRATEVEVRELLARSAALAKTIRAVVEAGEAREPLTEVPAAEAAAAEPMPAAGPSAAKPLDTQPAAADPNQAGR
jgi:hypothetical protein